MEASMWEQNLFAMKVAPKSPSNYSGGCGWDIANQLIFLA